MSEEEKFPIDGSEPGAQKYDTIPPLKSGPDASPAVFAADLQNELDKAPDLPDPSEFRKIEQVRSVLGEYKRLHMKTSEPSHTILDQQKEAPLLEDELLPPTHEIDMLALEKVRRDIPGYLQGQTSFRPPKIFTPSTEKKPVSVTTNETLENPKFKTIDDAVLNLVKGKTLSKDEIIDLVVDHKDEISPEQNRTRVTIGNTVMDLLSRKTLVMDKRGGLSVIAIAGGSTDFPEEEKFLHTKWAIPDVFSEKFDEVLSNEHDPARRKKLIAFHKFDMEIARDRADLEKRLSNAKGNGVFSPDQYTYLVSVLNSETILPEEVTVPQDNLIKKLSTDEGFVDGIRIGAENWRDQKLEDEQGNRLPLTPENYIKSVGLVLNPENIQKVTQALDSLVDSGIASRTSQGYEVRKVSRIAKKESTQEGGIFTGKEKTPEISPALFLALNDLADHSSRPAGVKALIFSLKEPGVTREQANALLRSSVLFDEDTKKKLLGILFNASTGDVVEPPPIVENISSDLPFPGDPPVVPHLDLDGNEVVATNDSVLPNVTTSEKVVPFSEVDFDTLGKKYEHTEDSLREDLAKARESFAKYEAEYKQKINEDKKGYHKLMASLGVPEKQRVLSPKTPEYLEAEKAHMEAKWNLKNFFAGINIEKVPFEYTNSLIGPEEGAMKIIDVGVTKQMENEARVFLKRVEDFMPEKEKGEWRKRLDKGLEMWSKVPLAARLPLTTLVLVGGTYLLGNIGVAAALTAGGIRLGRAGVGTAAALGAGKYFDGIKRKKIEKDTEERQTEYGGSALYEKEVFNKEDEILKQKIEKENKDIKNNRLKKAGIMAAVGGLTTLGTGVAQGMYMGDGVPEGAKVKPNLAPDSKLKVPETTEGKGPTLMDKLLRETPLQKVYIDPVKVDLSSKGFIDTVHQLQEQLHGKPMSPKLAELMAQKPEKIAMDLGLYKPGQAAESAFGLQNEYLAVDAEGEISFVHSDGTTIDKLFDGEKVKPYAGKMFDADKLATSAVPEETIRAPKVAEVLPVKAEPIVSPVPQPELSIRAGTPESIGADVAVTTTSLLEKNGKVEALVSHGVEIATPIPGYKDVQDMISGKLPLQKDFQFSPDSGARLEYNKFFEKTLISMDPNLRSQMFDYRLSIPYKGGQFNVFQKGKDITILLNGEKIGSTQLIDGKFGFQFESGLEKGIFAKSEYEVAFEEVKKAIVKNTSKFLKTTK